MNPRDHLIQRATATGFRVVRLARVGPTPHFDAFERFLAAGYHGEMGYLAERTDVRADPRRQLASARSAVVLAVEHHHVRPPDPGGRTGLVARYAWGRDYHNLVGKRLKKLKKLLNADGIACWGGVDTAAIIERAWADAAGIGFVGKNNLIIAPARTSYMFLAVLFTTLEAEPDPPITRDHCGKCARCLTACPTSAFRGPRDLDATRCIAYWTIEARAIAPVELRGSFGRWVFGCDVCQEVCPHNADPPDPEEDDLLPRHAFLDLDEIVRSPDDQLAERFVGTPLARPGPAGLKRNALIALGNLQDPGGIASIEVAIADQRPVVREAAAWALRMCAR